MKVTLYSLPGSACHSCRFTKRKLETAGVDYDEVRLDQDADAMEKVKLLGYSSAPVVVVALDDEDLATWTWQGYRPTEIDRLIELRAA